MNVQQIQGHKIYHENVNPKQGYTHAKFERSHSNSVIKKGNIIFFSNEKICLSPFNTCEKTQTNPPSDIFKIYLMFDLLDVINNRTKFQLHWISTTDTKFSVKTIWHCCDIEILSRSLKVVWMNKAQYVLPSWKVWHLSYLQCPRKL